MPAAAELAPERSGARRKTAWRPRADEAEPRSIIAGIGGYLPERVVSNDELARRLDTSDAWIAERTGIRQRHIASAERDRGLHGRRRRPRRAARRRRRGRTRSMP